jgi:hypothetical protein
VCALNGKHRLFLFLYFSNAGNVRHKQTKGTKSVKSELQCREATRFEPPHEVGEFLKGTPRTVLSDTDYYRHRYDDGHGKPKPSRDNSGLRESTPRGSTIQSRGHPERALEDDCEAIASEACGENCRANIRKYRSAALAHNGVRQYANPTIQLGSLFFGTNGVKPDEISLGIFARAGARVWRPCTCRNRRAGQSRLRTERLLSRLPAPLAVACRWCAPTLTTGSSSR